MDGAPPPSTSADPPLQYPHPVAGSHGQDDGLYDISQQQHSAHFAPPQPYHLQEEEEPSYQLLAYPAGMPSSQHVPLPPATASSNSSGGREGDSGGGGAGTDGSASKPKSSARFGVACLKCRSRKIKCDGQKPLCENCLKKGFECTFDEVPRTRGPDKKPGRKRRTAAQKAADTKLEEELRAQGIKVPVKPKRKRSPVPAAGPAPETEGSMGASSSRAKTERTSPVLADAAFAQPVDQLVASTSTLAAPGAVNGGTHRYLSGQWGLAPPTMDDYVRRTQSQAGSVHVAAQDPAVSSAGQSSYARHAPLSYPPLSATSGAVAYSTGPLYPNSPIPPSYLQPYLNPSPSPHQQQFAPYGTLPSVEGVAAEANALQGPAYGQGPAIPYQQQQQHASQLVPLADFQRPAANSFQTPSHVDLPMPSTGPLASSQSNARLQQQETAPLPLPDRTRQGPPPPAHVVNLAPPSRAPFYALPNDHVAYFAHPYAPPKADSHPILDHLIEHHGFMLPDTAGSAFRANPDGPGAYALPQAQQQQQMGESGQKSSGEHAGGAGGSQLARTDLGGLSPRLMLNDLLLPQGTPHEGGVGGPSTQFTDSFAPQGFRTHSFPDFPSPSPPNSAPWQPRTLSLPKQPTSDYTRKIWWDALLGQYGSTRQQAYTTVMGEIGHLFRVSNHWTAFFHIPRFIAILHQPQRREQLQPALVYAVLALSTQLSSWDGPGGKGFAGRLLGLKLNEQAHANFWSSWNSGWIDADLAKAAFLMALYEISCHPIHSDARSAQAMTLLDNVLRTLQLCSLDADNPRVSRYDPGEVPCVPENAAKVPCTTYPEKVLDAEMSTAQSPFWAACPRWSTASHAPSDAEIIKDESRRLTWSSCALAASISMYSHNVWRERADDWYISNCENFALLFPGELLFDPAHGKSNVWSLYYTTALLWNFAIRSHYDTRASAQVKRDKAFEVWATTTRIEGFFQPSSTPTSNDNRSVPWPEQISKLAYGWQSRDWLVTARFLVADSVKAVDQNNVGGTADMIHSATAREWLAKQSEVAKSLMPATDSFGKYSTALVNHRPILLWWLLQQLARILDLFDSDPTFTDTLDVARRDFCPIIEIFAQLYPSVGLYEVVVHRVVSRLNEALAMASGAFQQAFPASNPLLPRFPPFYFKAAPGTLIPHDQILEMMARDPLPDGLHDDSPPYQFAAHQQPQVKREVYH